MDFNEYQSKIIKTAKYPDIGKNFVYPTLGLAGETGEVAEKIKEVAEKIQKILRDHDGIIDEKKREELEKEIGDVLWYLAMLCTELRIELGRVAKVNIKKLLDRLDRNVIQGEGDNR
jgi:NTP pyrophosphatase (non-canonical NTP hydrolase)